MQQPSSKPMKTHEVSLSQDFVSQEDVNQLYETYYHRIHQAIAEKKDSKPLLILLGETHNESLLYNLIVFEIVRNTGKFNHLFIEQGKKFSKDFSTFKNRDEFKKIEEEAYYDQDSFLYLYFFANRLQIPAIPVEKDEYHDAFGSCTQEKEMNQLMNLRNSAMADNVSPYLISSGISILLCGSDHIPGLMFHLKHKKNCDILPLNKDNFTIYNEESDEEKILPTDGREIHAMVLQAQLNFMVKTGEFGAALVTDSDSGSPSHDSVKPKEKKINSTPTLSKITGFFSTSQSPTQSSAPSSEKTFDAENFKQTIKDELESFSFSLPGILSRPLNDRLELLEDLSESGEIQDWLAETYDLFAKNDRWQKEDAKPIFDKLDAWLDSMKSLHGMTKK